MEAVEGKALSNSAVIPFSAAEKPVPDANGGYQAVRFNAVRHGILCKLAVLAHEDHAEFDDLLAALIEEHRPAGITERHLIDELATIIWRKRRVLLAEGAKINEGLKNTLRSPKTVIPAAAVSGAQEPRISGAQRWRRMVDCWSQQERGRLRPLEF
jgi:hypothetical protein